MTLNSAPVSSESYLYLCFYIFLSFHKVKFIPTQAMSAPRDWNLDCKVYVGEIGYGAAKQELEDIFSEYGPLKNVWVARNPPGFAFVEFEDHRDARDAVDALDGT